MKQIYQWIMAIVPPSLGVAAPVFALISELHHIRLRVDEAVHDLVSQRCERATTIVTGNLNFEIPNEGAVKEGVHALPARRHGTAPLAARLRNTSLPVTPR